MTKAQPGMGRVVAVLGPDGSGKSTFCDALIESNLRTRKVWRLHHRPGALVSRNSSGRPTTEPHAEKSYSMIASVGKLVFLFLDFRIGWWTKIGPFVRRGGWVIWERPWWDIIVDPTRYRLQHCGGLARALGNLLPPPDLVFVLEAPAPLLLARKQEVSEAELIRQTDELHQVLPHGVRSIFLDSSKPIFVLVEQATRELDDLREPG